MKRFLSFILFAVAILAAWFFLLKRPQGISSTEKTESVQPVLGNIQTTSTKAAIINSLPTASKPILTNKIILNATSAQNIEEWKAAVTNLHNDSTLKENWVMWQSYTNEGLPFIVGDTNHAWVQFNANLVNINTRDNHSDIRNIEMHSAWMNITELRSFGDSLLLVLGKDETSFNIWCDKVGNHWVDAPLYDSSSSRLPNSNKFYGFGVHRTFNNEKPWYILFFITDP